MNASRGVDTSSPGLTKSQRELIAFLSEGHTSPAADRVNRWIACSPRYAAFVEQYKHKIRKKLRVTREPEAAADLLYELQLPYWLLQEPRFEVAYEPYSAGKVRGPDYAVTFRTNYTFNIEVTHTRGLQQTPAAEPGGEVLLDFRLVNVLCNKIRQLTQGSATCWWWCTRRLRISLWTWPGTWPGSRSRPNAATRPSIPTSASVIRRISSNTSCACPGWPCICCRIRSRRCSGPTRRPG